MRSRALLTIAILALTGPAVGSERLGLPMTLGLCSESPRRLELGVDRVVDWRGGSARSGELSAAGRRRIEEFLATERYVSALSGLRSEQPTSLSCAGAPILRIFHGGEINERVVQLARGSWIPDAIRDVIAILDEELPSALGPEYVAVGASLEPPERVEGDPCPDPTIWRYRPFVGEVVEVLSVDLLRMDLASVVETVTTGGGKRSRPSEHSFDEPVGRRVIRLGGVARCDSEAACGTFEDRMRRWLRGKRLHVGIAPHLWARDDSEPPPAVVRDTIEDPDSINEAVLRRGWARFREEAPCAVGPFFERRLRAAAKP